MGQHLDMLDWVEAQPIPDTLSNRTPKAWVAAYFAEINEQPEKAVVRSLLSGIARRLRPDGSHHHLLTHFVPPKARTGKQAAWGGDAEPVRDTTIIAYAPSSALQPLMVHAAKNGHAHPTTDLTLQSTIKALDSASQKHQKAAVAGILAEADETALERVQRLNAEERLRDAQTQLEDARADKRAWQELAIARTGGRGTAVNK